ncbi:MAG: hypothetical protein JWM80_6228 [Cyanobacteria bacterium RYN_339]|nr:hypothetical protein [Cyanobacteria bacterium RYN_339]
MTSGPVGGNGKPTKFPSAGNHEHDSHVKLEGGKLKLEKADHKNDEKGFPIGKKPQVDPGYAPTKPKDKSEFPKDLPIDAGYGVPATDKGDDQLGKLPKAVAKKGQEFDKTIDEAFEKLD